MISVTEARRLILARIVPLRPRPAGLADAAGHVLAEAVLAAEAVPPFSNSAMDGYAVRAADAAVAPARLRVRGAVAAGDEPGAALGPGEAIRIMTGAPLPAGADAVCIIERVQVLGGGSAVVIESAVRPAANVRRPGEDIAAGSTVFSAGSPLRAAHVGVLASLGVESLLVYPDPAVGVLSTGSELVPPGHSPAPGKIRDANRPALLAQLSADGFRGVDLGIGADDQEALSELLTACVPRCDAVVASGGVSVGDHDMLKPVLEKLGGTAMLSLDVAVEPGRHVAFALVGKQQVPVFGLPGNPVAALVAYELYVRPALRAMAGYAVLDRPRLTAIAEADMLRQPGPKLHLLRVTARTEPNGVLRVLASGGQQSHMLRAMAYADALALLPDGHGVRAGQPVEVLILDADSLPPAGPAAWP